jgi:acyl-CoA thioester hydrolase
VVATSNPLPGAFRYRRRVEFAETDMAGIVHFSCYFRYMEEAEHALWRAAGMSIFRPEGDLDWPRVSAACEYANPLHFEDDIEVTVEIASLGRRSIQYAFTIRAGGRVAGTGKITSVCVRKGASPLKAIDVPEEVAARLRAALG